MSTATDYIKEETEIMEARDNNFVTINKELFFGRLISEFKLFPAKTVTSDATLDQAVDLIQKHNIGSVLIVEAGLVVGILTQRDIIMKVQGIKSDNSKILVTEIMTKTPICLRPTDTIMYVMNNMHTGGFRHLPIVDEHGGPLCIISMRDVLGYFFNSFSEDISNTVSEPYRGEHNRDDG